jgi:hypothetical protein
MISAPIPMPDACMTTLSSFDAHCSCWAASAGAFTTSTEPAFSAGSTAGTLSGFGVTPPMVR